MDEPRHSASQRLARTIVVILASVLSASSGRAKPADFLALCEANQVYDTGKPTTDNERQVCRCIEHRLDPAQEEAAVQVFQKVLAARHNGLGLHPSQVDLDELVALMAFADNLRACGDEQRVGRAAF